MDIATAANLAAEAFALAEGYPHPTAIPWRARNPGDLQKGDLGHGTINLKTIFPSHSAGWAALEQQTLRIITGTSPLYKPGSTILQIATKYTGNDNPATWAQTVAHHLHLSTSDPIDRLLEL